MLHIFVSERVSNQCSLTVNWTLENKLQWNSNQNTKIFIQGNAFENVVCETAVILSRGRWVKITAASPRGQWIKPSGGRTSLNTIETNLDMFQCSYNIIQNSQWDLVKHSWELTLLVLKAEYSRIIMSIPWLMMPWLLASPWYWTCRINRSLSSMENNLNKPKPFQCEKWCFRKQI